LDYYKREKQKIADNNKNYQRDIKLNLETNNQYDLRGKQQ